MKGKTGRAILVALNHHYRERYSEVNLGNQVQGQAKAQSGLVIGKGLRNISILAQISAIKYVMHEPN